MLKEQHFDLIEIHGKGPMEWLFLVSPDKPEPIAISLMGKINI